MLTFGAKIEGLTAAALARAGTALRPEYLKVMRRVLYRARGRMVQAASGPVLRARSGMPSVPQRGRTPTATLLKRAKVSVGITADGVVGRLTHGAKLLNIHEGGANVPAAIMKKPSSKFGARLAFRFPGGGFARGTITRGGFRLPARPIAGPVLNALIPVAQEQLAAKAVDILEGFKKR